MKVIVTWTEKEKFPLGLGSTRIVIKSVKKKKLDRKANVSKHFLVTRFKVKAPNFTPLAARPPSDRPPSEKDSPGQQPAMSERKAVIKNADMSEDMQQDAIDCATQARVPDARSMT